jgi:hypothetical protein
MLVMLLGIAVALLALAPGAASAQPLTCGQTITQDTTLQADLGPCPGDGLVIGAGNLTLDLNGHAIIGNATGDDVGVRDQGYDGVVVEDGRIRGFRTDVKLDANQSRTRGITARLGTSSGGAAFSISGSYNSIENNVARGQTWESHGFDITGSHNTLSDNASLGLGGVAVRGGRNAVTHNVLVDAEFGGLSVYGPRNLIAGNSVQGGESTTFVSGPGNVIRENQLHGGSAGSAGPSLGVHGDCRNVRVEGNTVREGMTVGACQNARIEDNSLHAGMDIHGGSGNTIRQNTVSGAEAGGAEVGNGIGVYGGSGNSIEKNTISDADLSGIFVGEHPYVSGDHSVGTTVRGNLVTRSGFDSYAGHNDDGIHVDDPGTLIGDNTANDNFDYGIQAVPGVIDGGGNTASGNGNPLQCLNVVCN